MVTQGWALAAKVLDRVGSLKEGWGEVLGH